MANTIDEFLQLFGGDDSTVNDQQVAQYHDRFVSTKPDDRLFDNSAYHNAVVEHLGSLPAANFNQTAHNAVAQAAPEQRQDLLSTLLGAIAGSASGSTAGTGSNSIGDIARMLGLNSADPRQMSNDDATKVFNFARTQHPDAMRQTVAEKPWFIQALGNPVVMSALTMAAAKLLTSTQQRPS